MNPTETLRRAAIFMAILFVPLTIQGKGRDSGPHRIDWESGAWWIERIESKGKYFRRMTFVIRKGKRETRFGVVFAEGGLGYLVDAETSTGRLLSVVPAWFKFTREGLRYGRDRGGKRFETRVNQFSVRSKVFIPPIDVGRFHPDGIPERRPGDEIPVAVETKDSLIWRSMSSGDLRIETAESTGVPYVDTYFLYKGKDGPVPDGSCVSRLEGWGDDLMALDPSSTPAAMTRITRPPVSRFREDVMTLESLFEKIKSKKPVEEIDPRGSNYFGRGDRYTVRGRMQYLKPGPPKKSTNPKSKVRPVHQFQFEFRVLGTYRIDKEDCVILHSVGADRAEFRDFKTTSTYSRHGYPSLTSFNCAPIHRPNRKTLKWDLVGSRLSRLSRINYYKSTVSAGGSHPVSNWILVVRIRDWSLFAMYSYHRDATGKPQWNETAQWIAGMKPVWFSETRGPHGLRMNRLVQGFRRYPDCLHMSFFPALGARSSTGSIVNLFEPLKDKGVKIHANPGDLKMEGTRFFLSLKELTDAKMVADWTPGNVLKHDAYKDISLRSLVALAGGRVNVRDSLARYQKEMVHETYASWNTVRATNAFNLFAHDGKNCFVFQKWGAKPIPIWSQSTTIDLNSNTLVELWINSPVRASGGGRPLPLMELDVPEKPPYPVRPAPTGPRPSQPREPDPDVEIPDY